MFKTKKLVITALLIALGIVLPVALHSIPNAGSIFLPMHIPVLLCGLMLGWQYGLACGVLTPVLSSLITGMPPFAYLPSMVFELAAYGLVAGLLIKYVRTKSKIANTYIALIGAMLAGRVLFGLLNALIFRFGAYSLSIWLAGAFVTALPGILIQLIIIPVLILAIEKAKLI